MPLPACSAAQRRAIGGLLARAVATAAERAGSCAGLADPGRSGCLQAGRAAGEQAALGLRRFAGQGSGGGGRGAGRLVGFVFDIDGVLQRGTRMLPAGLQAVQLLYESDRTTPRYPVCFMTNGGGTTEGQRAQELSERLDVAVHESQVVLSHTPMQHLVPRFRDHPVLVCGRHDVASVARSYGFRRPLTTSQIAAAFPDAVPFAPPPGAAAAAEQPCPLSAGGVGTEEAIRSVLVMTDPSNWYVDLQLLCDVVLGNGFLVMPDRGRSKSMQPEAEGVPVYFSNPDLLWANSFPRPRFGQGGFSTSFAALHRAVTGRPPPHVHFLGKPHAVQYRWTEQALAQQAVRLGLLPPSVLPHHVVGTDGDTTGLLHTPVAASLFSSIYMIGDNPASDIRGANLAGPPWIGVLVRTGVFQGVANNHRDRAAFVVDDALAAIRAAQHRERSAVWHSLR